MTKATHLMNEIYMNREIFVTDYNAHNFDVIHDFHTRGFDVFQPLLHSNYLDAYSKRVYDY